MARAGNKQALLDGMLARDRGASIREMVDLTGWKANSVHSALSSLRTSGRDIAVEDIGGERRYRLAAD